MGYNVYLTRAEYWDDSDDHPVTLEEWLSLVAADPDLSPVPDRPGAARWRGASVHAEPWFAWEDGAVYTKNPDRAVIDKLVGLAETLGANVQGEEGERYTGGERGFTPP